MGTKPLNLSDVKNAATRIKDYVHRTPVLTSTSIDRILKARIFFKCENFEKVGAFKFRGACNAVFSLTEDEIHKGVATHSSGNHAAALALAARMRKTKAYIVMPENAPQIKIAAVEEYGGKIIFCKPTLAARETTLKKVVEKTGAVFIHPYNDRRVIAGQGTAALELLQEVSELDFVMCPVGGGGLLSGTALCVNGMSPNTKVVAVEPKGADDAYRSFYSGEIVPSVNPKTIADGLLTSLGSLTFPLIQRYVSDIITVSEDSIIQAMRFIWERMKIIIEPSAAVPVGALIEAGSRFRRKRIGVILSGGNLDFGKLPW